MADRILVEVTDGTMGGAIELRAHTLDDFVALLKNVSGFANFERTADYIKICNGSGTIYKWYFAPNSLISC